MRRAQRRCVGAVLSVFVAGSWISSARPAGASPRGRATLQDTTPSAAGSVLDGVFTADQAKLGGQRFQKNCSACHTVADHTGRRFAAKWAGTSLGDLFDLMSSTMPDGNPGSLEPEEYASIIAFLLRETGYPGGKDELPADSAVLMKVRIEPPAAK